MLTTNQMGQMSNYLRVGSAGDNKDSGLSPAQGAMHLDIISHSSSQGGVNLLNQTCGHHTGRDERGANVNYNNITPNQQKKQQPGGGLGGIPGAINNDNAFDIQSNVSLGEGLTRGGGGEGKQPARNTPRGVIMARIQTATIKRELDWQARVKGNGYKSAAFRDQALGQQAFQAFAFMKGKSPVVHMAHLVGTFFGISGLASEVQGKHIAFVRDRGNGRYPVPFILPP